MENNIKSNKELMLQVLERIMIKVTSGKFIFTVITAMVYAYLAVNGKIEDNRVSEITLIVLYAYFNKPTPQ